MNYYSLFEVEGQMLNFQITKTKKEQYGGPSQECIPISAVCTRNRSSRRRENKKSEEKQPS